MLYLGSQVEKSALINEASTNYTPKQTSNETEQIKKIKDLLENSKNITGVEQNSALLSSDNSNSCEGNSTSYVTAVSTTFQEVSKDVNLNEEAIKKSANFLISNDLLTDDEKENNLSY